MDEKIIDLHTPANFPRCTWHPHFIATEKCFVCNQLACAACLKSVFSYQQTHPVLVRKCEGCDEKQKTLNNAHHQLELQRNKERECTSKDCVVFCLIAIGIFSLGTLISYLRQKFY